LREIHFATYSFSYIFFLRAKAQRRKGGAKVVFKSCLPFFLFRP
jgi:hypothetical protein